jgi:hypothetical protein
VPSATDGPAHAAEQVEDCSYHQQNDPERPQDRDTGYETDYQQNNAKDDHALSLFVATVSSGAAG